MNNYQKEITKEIEHKINYEWLESQVLHWHATAQHYQQALLNITTHVPKGYPSDLIGDDDIVAELRQIALFALGESDVNV